MADGETVDLTPDLLWEIGYRSLTRTQVTNVLAELLETLEARVGVRLTEGMDHNEIATFEQAYERGGIAAATKWLNDHVPHHRDVVRVEYNYIVGTLARAGKMQASEGRKMRKDRT